MGKPEFCLASGDGVLPIRTLTLGNMTEQRGDKKAGHLVWGPLFIGDSGPAVNNKEGAGRKTGVKTAGQFFLRS